MITLTDLEISDIFFNYVKDYEYLKTEAENFIELIPSLKKQGYTVQSLINDYLHRL